MTRLPGSKTTQRGAASLATKLNLQFEPKLKFTKGRFMASRKGNVNGVRQIGMDRLHVYIWPRIAV